MKRTVVIGASPNPSRVAYSAVQLLREKGHDVIPIGIKPGNIDGLEIVLEHPAIKDVDTVTLYLNPAIQPEYYDYILGLQPKRLIFNPGTENMEFVTLAKENNIEVEVACTLVLLKTGQY